MNRIQSLKISISGIRGIVGETLTPQLLTAFAGAFGTYVGRGPIMLGRDTRSSGEMVRNAVFAGLLSAGCEPVDLGICPVPSIQIRTKDVHARGGIAITASHNPAEWNALKFIGREGLFLNTHQAEELLDIYHQRAFTQVASGEIRSIRLDADAVTAHLRRLHDCFDAHVIGRARIRVVLDSCNGAGSVAAPRFLRELGCSVVELHTDPKGGFPRSPEPVPENLGALCSAVRRHKADIGLAQDADADRLAIVNSSGTPIGEEYTLTLAVLFILGKQKGPVVTNLSTTRAIDDIAARFGCPVARTRIGEINVVEEMIQTGAAVGGEGNGGVILPAVHYCRDSMSGMGAVLQLMAERRKPLEAILREIPHYEMIKDKATVAAERVPAIHDALRRLFPEAEADTRDGLKLSWKQGWLHLRLSNTEPILRIVAESPSRRQSQSLVRTAKRLIARGAKAYRSR
jgi:phosphomannomutase